MQLSSAVFAFSTACLAALLLTPMVRRLAVHAGWRDKPSQAHKTHRAARPNAGGIALLLSLTLALLSVRAGFEAIAGRLDVLLLAVAPGAVLVSAMGLLDDLRGCRPLEKLLAQMVALALLHTGADVLGVSLLADLPLALALGVATVVALWMLGLTNAMNLIDGIDGLAAGVSVFSGLGLVAFALLLGDPAAATLAAALTGASLGFLRTNRAPARIYLGDSGSLLLGYLLAVVGAVLLAHRPEPLMAVCLLLLGWVPLLDTAYAVLRRLRSGVSPFQADRDHIHHRIVARGVSTERAAFLLWALQALAVVAALAILTGADILMWTGAVLLATLPLARVMRPFRVTRPVAASDPGEALRPVEDRSPAADPRAA